MNKVQILQAWISAGVKDFYISFEFEAEHKWPEYSVFFCHQGLEKLCKAYILATSASEWENLPDECGLKVVEKKVKDLGHGLRSLIKHVQLPKQNEMPGFLKAKDGGETALRYRDEDLIDILEKAYIEARYPAPQSNRIHRNFPLPSVPGFYSDPLRETAPIKYARNSALTLLRRLESDFSMKVPTDKTIVSNRIEDAEWARFQRVFFKSKKLKLTDPSQLLSSLSFQAATRY